MYLVLYNKTMIHINTCILHRLCSHHPTMPTFLFHHPIIDFKPNKPPCLTISIFTRLCLYWCISNYYYYFNYNLTSMIVINKVTSFISFEIYKNLSFSFDHSFGTRLGPTGRTGPIGNRSDREPVGVPVRSKYWIGRVIKPV